MNGEGKGRAVYDCNVYVQALISPRGPGARCVEHAVEGAVELFISQTILDEVWDAPNKPTPARLGVTVERVAKMVNELLRVATVVTAVPRVFEYERDPDDAHYVNLALAAGAELVVSRDRDLLDLMDERRPDGAAFRARFPSLRIVDPVEFLRWLDGLT